MLVTQRDLYTNINSLKIDYGKKGIIRPKVGKIFTYKPEFLQDNDDDNNESIILKCRTKEYEQGTHMGLCPRELNFINDKWHRMYKTSFKQRIHSLEDEYVIFCDSLEVIGEV